MTNNMKTAVGIVLIIASMWGYGWYKGKVAPSVIDTPSVSSSVSSSTSPEYSGHAVAYVAGGCFWCVESDFEKLSGVSEVISGYMGGTEEHPSYNQVSSGSTDYRESVKITYDANRVTYRDILLYFFRHVDPTDSGGSFYDRGRQYTSAIYYQTEEEKRTAESVLAELEAAHVFSKPIVTDIELAGDFWIAEKYHQDYYKKNPIQYSHYRTDSGRDAFIESVWGAGTAGEAFNKSEQEKNNARPDAWKRFQKPDDETLKSMLTPLQYDVTQKEGTETPFENEYWDNHEAGIYVDIVSGEPLFSSTDKFDSGTGWPSFLKPIDASFVTEHQDYKLIIPRTEIRSVYADSHLGHIILDGPVENDRIRYCMNSVALRFVPKEDMEQERYGDFLYLFEEQ